MENNDISLKANKNAGLLNDISKNAIGLNIRFLKKSASCHK